MNLKTPRTVLIALLAALVTASLPAAESAPAAPASPAERETLTADWGGAGAEWRTAGVTLTASWTQFYQGLLSGDGTRDFEYGGKLDAFLKLDGAKLGLGANSSLNSHFELNHGDSAGSAGGPMLPGNTALLFPGSGSAIADLSLHVIKPLSARTVLIFGKINMVDMYAGGRSYSGGRGVEKFQHVEFVAPISGITPPMMFGAILSTQTKAAKYTLMIYDPSNRTRQTGLDHAFTEGVTFNGSVELAGKFGDLPGKHVFSAAYSTQNGLDFADLPELLIPGGTPPAQSLKHRWYFAYAVEQALWQDATDPKKTWGFFAQAARSDGNPNPFEWSIIAGLGGTSPLPGRSRDRFGVGFFHVGLSDKLKSSLQPVVPVRDESGVEVFYNFALTPWLRLTTDLQVIRSANSTKARAVTGGLRMQLIF